MVVGGQPALTEHGIRRRGAQELGDLVLAHRLALDLIPAQGLGAFGQQLHGAHAITAHGLKKLKGFQ